MNKVSILLWILSIFALIVLVLYIAILFQVFMLVIDLQSELMLHG